MIRTAVDSSVLLDVFGADPVYGHASMESLEQCWKEGGLVSCEVVWAEIRPRFESHERLLEVTRKVQLAFDSIEQETALLAGEVWKKYRALGGKRERLIPDFLVAAHALVQADRLLTRDRGFYKKYFPNLKIEEPSS